MGSYVYVSLIVHLMIYHGIGKMGMLLHRPHESNKSNHSLNKMAICPIYFDSLNEALLTIPYFSTGGL